MGNYLSSLFEVSAEAVVIWTKFIHIRQVVWILPHLFRFL